MVRRSRGVLAALSGAALAAAAAGAADPAAALEEALARVRKEPDNFLLVRELRAAVAAAPDGDAKARGLAVYSLGCLLYDQGPEAAAAREQVFAHYPKSPYAAALTDSAIQRSCPRCGGANTGRKACARCQGTGRCPGCGGKGRLDRLNNQKVTCPQCRGGGRCPECRGRKSVGQDCPVCRGTGRTTDYRQVRLLLRSLVRYEGSAPAGDGPGATAPPN